MAQVRARRIVLIVLVLLVLIVAGLTYYSYERDIVRAVERISTSSWLAETPCGPIEYALAGDGPPVLFVHGAGGGFDQGLELGQGLVERGFRVIAMSRFGYLRTPLPEDASAAAQADAHACLLDALNIPRAAVVGASAGAPSSMQLAIRHPARVAALVLVVPAAYVPRPGGAPPVQSPPHTALLFDSALNSDFLFWAATRFARETMIRAILGTPPEVVAGASADEQRRIAQVLEHVLPVSARRRGLINDARIVGSLKRYDLERIGAPTLTISSKDDLYGTWDGARYTADHIRGARFLGYPSGGHLGVGHQQEMDATIADFVRPRARPNLPATK